MVQPCFGEKPEAGSRWMKWPLPKWSEVRNGFFVRIEASKLGGIFFHFGNIQ
jgi:hypothetical protein